MRIWLLRRVRDLLWDASHTAGDRERWAMSLICKRLAVRVERLPGVGPRPIRPFRPSPRKAP